MLVRHRKYSFILYHVRVTWRWIISWPYMLNDVLFSFYNLLKCVELLNHCWPDIPWTMWGCTKEKYTYWFSVTEGSLGLICFLFYKLCLQTLTVGLLFIPILIILDQIFYLPKKTINKNSIKQQCINSGRPRLLDRTIHQWPKMLYIQFIVHNE